MNFEEKFKLLKKGAKLIERGCQIWFYRESSLETTITIKARSCILHSDDSS